MGDRPPVQFPVRQLMVDKPVLFIIIKSGKQARTPCSPAYNIALAFNMTLAEFLDFDELNDYSFDDDNDEE